jgi:hypothetical protein
LGSTSREILSVRNTIARTWKNPKRYAENIVPPRINWLLDLGLVKISNNRLKSAGLTQIGHQLMAALPKFEGSGLSYVEKGWIRANFFGVAGPVIMGQAGKPWRNLSQNEKNSLLRDLVSQGFNALRSSPTPKVSLLPILLFVAISLAANHQIWINLNELREEMEHSSKEPNSLFEVRFSNRENESYLILRPA